MPHTGGDEKRTGARGHTTRASGRARAGHEEAAKGAGKRFHSSPEARATRPDPRQGGGRPLRPGKCGEARRVAGPGAAEAEPPFPPQRWPGARPAAPADTGAATTQGSARGICRQPGRAGGSAAPSPPRSAGEAAEPGGGAARLRARADQA